VLKKKKERNYLADCKLNNIIVENVSCNIICVVTYAREVKKLLWYWERKLELEWEVQLSSH